MVKYPFCISDSSRCFSPSFLFTFLFLFYSCLFLLLLLHPSPPHPPPYLVLSFPSLLSLLPLLSSRCCHANFPGDSVVMDTERQGRSADVWCRSGMCTNRSPAYTLSSSLFPARLACDPCGSCSPHALSRLVFLFFLFTRWSLSVSSTYHHPQLQCDLTDFVYKLRWMLHMCSYVILF